MSSQSKFTMPYLSRSDTLPDHIPPIAMPETPAERQTQLMLLALGWYIACEKGIQFQVCLLRKRNHMCGLPTDPSQLTANDMRPRCFLLPFVCVLLFQPSAVA